MQSNFYFVVWRWGGSWPLFTLSPFLMIVISSISVQPHWRCSSIWEYFFSLSFKTLCTGMALDWNYLIKVKIFSNLDAGRFVDVLDLDMILRPVRRQSICYTSAIKTLLDALLKHLIHTDLIWTFICHSPPNIQDQPYNNGLMSSQPGLVWRVQGISGDTNRDFLQSILGNLGILICIPGWIEITMILPEQHSAHFLTVEVVLQNSCVTQNLGIKLSGPFDQTFLPFVWAQQISHLNKTTGVPQSLCKRMIEIFVIIWLELNLI